MEPIQIKKNIYWVGAIDWDIRNFHGYTTHKGSTYNSYLIIDKKITLVDTVKAPFADEMLERISKIIDPKKIDYIISNHVEPDHSGSLPYLMEMIPNVALYTSFGKGKEGLARHYKKDWNFNELKTGDNLNIGKRNLTFVKTPMVHWPDSMVTYIPEDKLLLPNDAFGQHLASFERFDDELDLGIIMEQAEKYYANIVLPFGSQVLKALDIVSGLEVDMIAPSHGIIWRKNIQKIIQKYIMWASNNTVKKAVIIYDSMWDSTHKIAKSIYDAFDKKNISAKLINIKNVHISDAMADVLEAEYICIGSPTLNNGMMPTVSGFLTYLKGLSPKHRKAVVFGSYGWSGQSVDHIADILKSLKLELLTEPIKINYVPDEAELNVITEQIKGLL